MTESHDDVVRREFTRQEASFARTDAYYAQLGAGTVAALQPLGRELLVLEVACGAAHAAEAVAPHVRQVVGVDLTPALLAAGAKRLAERGVRNVLLQEGDAARLPFLDASFDLVFCRAAVHHFVEPARQLREMARVCRPGGRVAVADMISLSADVRPAYDDLHRRIDPSHTSCLLEAEIVELLSRCVGARASARSSRSQPLSFEIFEHQSATSRPEVLDGVRAELRREIAGGPATGFEPSLAEDGSLRVRLTSVVATAVRP